MGQIKKKLTSFRVWLNIITFVLILVLIVFAWGDIKCLVVSDPVHCPTPYLAQVNIWILLLLIPVQVFSYYCNGMISFTYLRGRGKLKRISQRSMTAMSLELNFVNHVFPTGGLSGASYMVWRLGKADVSPGQATMSQIIQKVVFGAAFTVLMAISLLFVTVDNNTGNWIILLAALAVAGMFALILFASYLFGSRRRIRSFGKWVARLVNKIVARISFGRKKQLLAPDAVRKFCSDIYDDFSVIKAQKSLLVKPLIWSFIFIVADVSLFAVTFWALGVFINPALLLIAYGAAAMAGLFILTPGGAGAYEAIFILILTAGGAGASMATAGVIMTRVILILGTLATGYYVYHRAIRKYGEPDLSRKVDLTPDSEIAKAKNAAK